VGWKIWACLLQKGYPRLSLKELQAEIHRRFTEPEWFQVIYDNRIDLTFNPMQTEIKLQIQPEDLNVNGETETYLLTLTSDCLAWKQNEKDHKALMVTVMQMLPWQRAAAHIHDGEFKLVHWSGPVKEEEFKITATPRPDIQIPIRRRILKVKKLKQRQPKTRT